MWNCLGRDESDPLAQCAEAKPEGPEAMSKSQSINWVEKKGHGVEGLARRNTGEGDIDYSSFCNLRGGDGCSLKVRWPGRSKISKQSLTL